MTTDLFTIDDAATGIRITLSGPSHESRTSQVGGPEEPIGTLIVRTRSGSEPDVEVSIAGLLTDRVTADQSAPPLFEQTSYRLTVEGPVGVPLRIEQRDPRLVEGVLPAGRMENLLTGTLNFRSQIGMSRFRVLSSDVPVLTFDIEVFPTKIDYVADYVVMMSDVESAIRGLAFEYLRATSGRAGTTDDRSQWAVEWLTLVRNEAYTIASALHHIDRFPIRALRRDIQPTSVNRIRRPSRLTKRAIIAGRGTGAFAELADGTLIRSILPSIRAKETLDTSEHRWLKKRIDSISTRLARLDTALLRQVDRFRAVGWDTALLELQLREVADVRDLFTAIARTAVIRAAGDTVRPEAETLTLTQAPGYSDAHRALVRVDRALGVESDHVDISYKDVSELYQIWCFIAVVEVVKRALGSATVSGDVFVADETGLKVQLRRNRFLQLTSDDGTIVSVRAEPRFTGLTGTQVPDIVVGISRPSRAELLIVLDAKYRVDTSIKYAKRFRCAGPPIDAINALHRYRDAILVQPMSGPASRPVVRGAALFPFPGAEEDFIESPLHEALQQLGIGALPFLPGKQKLAASWLSDTLLAPAEVLSRPGPPFAGLESKW